ncbi:MAG: pyrroline-5-carboxylate reductase [Sandaracinus sp.]|nr:pyrroline-5-carboxylate reductase [Sandaracinus sp.]MCB9611275.1 pyrroline-5-carboxylate reductase [Sandaracinus sp.]MCB9620336.1 pyrroline-5-carboxylate reductase [Sandaracinus sp.]
MGHERLKQLRIGVIGAGNMGTTILEGLLDAGAADPSQLMASDPREARRKELSDRGVKTTASNLEVARFAQLLVLATKPQVFDRMLAEIAPGTGPETLVVSIAAGIPIDAIETQLAPGTRVVRTMPNTPALVGAGATAIAPGAHVSEEDLATVEALFASVGITEVLDESLMDAVTGLSGSGPAFIFVIIDALSDAGVKVGLHRSTAQRLAAQTVLGAAKMLIETGEHPGQLKDMVASPGGTTIAGLHTLEAGGLRKTLMDAVENATLRSKQLGEELAKRRG